MTLTRQTFDELIQLIARDIEKRPYMNVKTGRLACPNCNSDQILYHAIIKFPKYCIECGQVLNWEWLKGKNDDN